MRESNRDLGPTMRRCRLLHLSARSDLVLEQLLLTHRGCLSHLQVSKRGQVIRSRFGHPRRMDDRQDVARLDGLTQVRFDLREDTARQRRDLGEMVPVELDFTQQRQRGGRVHLCGARRGNAGEIR